MSFMRRPVFTAKSAHHHAAREIHPMAPMRIDEDNEMTKSRKGKNPHRGKSFDSFLKEEGIYGRANTTATKRTLARQLEKAMKQQDRKSVV